MLKQSILKGLVFVALLCGNLLYAGSITIAVAANVSYAMDDLIKAFHQKNADTEVKVILGSSGKLVAQIKNNAPFDLFMSADMKFPQALFDEGLAMAQPDVYALGSLAYLSRTPQDFKMGIKLLESSKIAKIAIANPKTAPYGKAAMEAIENAGMMVSIKDKFVYAESISQVVSYAITAADIGFVAKSSLYDSKMSQYKEDSNWAEVDPRLYTPIKQGMVILKSTKDMSGSKAFYDFILSEEARAIFEKYGYGHP